MKFLKILTISTLSLLILALSSTAASAQTYNCAWTSFGVCGVDLNTNPNACPGELDYDIKKCNIAKTQAACEAIGAIQCHQFTPDPNAPTVTIPSEGSASLDEIENQGLPSFRFRGGTLGSVVQFAIPWIFAIAGMLLLILLLSGGLSLMVSGGDQKTISESKAKITNSLLGFGVIFIAFWFVQLIARILGLQPIMNIFG